MEKCITDLIEAIKNVDNNYITVIGFHNDNSEYQQAAENAFSAELYHQYKSIIENNKMEYYKGLQLHYDLTKQRFNGQRPDLVLHRAPNSREDQRLYIEIKTNRTVINFDSDFGKIFLALEPNNENEKLGYKNAVFLSVKSPLNQVQESIKSYIKAHNLENDERLIRAYSIHLGNKKNITINKFSDL